MMFTAHYQSPLGKILLAADEVGLTGLWFDRAKYYAAGLAPQSTERETPPLTEAAAANPIRANDNIRHAGRPACGKAWHGAPVRPGGGRSRGT